MGEGLSLKDFRRIDKFATYSEAVAIIEKNYIKIMKKRR